MINTSKQGSCLVLVSKITHLERLFEGSTSLEGLFVDDVTN